MSRARRDAHSARENINYRINRDIIQQACGESLRTAGIETSPALFEAVAAYTDLLRRWNRKVNLTSVTDPAEILERHFAESFFAARWLGPGPGLLCDIGSGAGFPGLALKLVLPEWSVRLYEPNAKKAAFLKEVAHALNLRGLEVSRLRWQDARVVPGSVDAVSARALGGYVELAGWAAAVLRPGGKLLLWLGESDAGVVRRLPEWLWESQPLPKARERLLLIGVPRGKG
jgi:16S rRNA (guanine527-N7)-methyltransferase